MNGLKSENGFVTGRDTFNFNASHWLNDECLDKCALMTQGAWMNLLCRMRLDKGTGVICGTLDYLATKAKAPREQIRSIILELRDTETADVHVDGDIVTIINRRMSRDFKKLTDQQIRQKRRRVTLNARDLSKHATEEIDPEFIAIGVAIPPELDKPEFLTAWITFIRFRIERKPQMTPIAAQAALNKMRPWGVTKAVAAIQHSIASGYQGIFEAPRGHQTNAGAPNGLRERIDRDRLERARDSAQHQQHLAQVDIAVRAVPEQLIAEVTKQYRSEMGEAVRTDPDPSSNIAFREWIFAWSQKQQATETLYQT